MSQKISVVIPTIGRTEMLEQCISSISSNTLKPNEILVVSQSSEHSDLVRSLSRLEIEELKILFCPGRGIARNMNFALLNCCHDLVFVTHDDCTVDRNWIEKGAALYEKQSGLLTGRVMPPSGVSQERVPSVKTSMKRFDFTNTLHSGALYPCNMIFNRGEVVSFGGFDERDGLQLAAEDLDFCYRWLKAGKSVMYEPDIVVTHHDWRSPGDLSRLYRRYAYCTGCFYCKHLLAGDRIFIRWIWRDISSSVQAMVRMLFRRTKADDLERSKLLFWMPIGIGSELLRILKNKVIG